MKNFMLGSAMAVSLLLSSPGFAGGGHHGHWHHGRNYHHHRHYHHAPRYHPEYRPRYNYNYQQRNHYHAGGYGYRRHYDGHSPFGIILGGVVGGFLGSELSYGDPFATGAGAIAGSVIGHELDD